MSAAFFIGPSKELLAMTDSSALTLCQIKLSALLILRKVKRL